MERKDNTRVIIWFLVVVIILLVTVVVLLVIKASNSKENKLDLSTNNSNQEKIEDNITNKVVDNVENSASENVKTEIKEVIKEVEKYAFVKFDSSKVKDNSLSGLTDTLVHIGAPLNSAVISANGSVIAKIIKDNQSKDVPVVNLGGKVVDAIGGPVGDGAYSVMYLLMDDGTVEYTEDLWSARTSNNDMDEIKSVGKIDGLSNIVRICYLYNSKGWTPIAIDKDGNSYSLLGQKMYMRGLNL